jgi:hypothetical protein
MLIPKLLDRSLGGIAEEIDLVSLRTWIEHRGHASSLSSRPKPPLPLGVAKYCQLVLPNYKLICAAFNKSRSGGAFESGS